MVAVKFLCNNFKASLTMLNCLLFLKCLLAMSTSTAQQAILFPVGVDILEAWLLVVHYFLGAHILFGLLNMNLLIHFHVLVVFVRLKRIAYLLFIVVVLSCDSHRYTYVKVRCEN